MYVESIIQDFLRNKADAFHVERDIVRHQPNIYTVLYFVVVSASFVCYSCLIPFDILRTPEGCGFLRTRTTVVTFGRLAGTLASPYIYSHLAYTKIRGL